MSDKNRKKKNHGKNIERNADAFNGQVVNAVEIAAKFKGSATTPIQPLSDDEKKLIVKTIMASAGIKLGQLRFAVVPVNVLEIDAAYQRIEAHDITKLYREGFDVEKTGVLLLSYRNDKLYIIDGAHRDTGAILSGVTHLLALIYTDLTQADEARLFREQNKGCSTVKPIQDYKAGLVAQDIDCLTLRDITDKYNIRITTNRTKSGARLGSIRCALNIITRHNNTADTLDWMFGLMKRSLWLTGEHDKPLTAQYMDNLANIYDDAKKADNLDIVTERLFSVMSEVYPDMFDAYAKINYQSTDKRGFTGKALTAIAEGQLTISDIPTVYQRRR